MLRGWTSTESRVSTYSSLTIKRIEKPSTVADPYVTLTYSKLGKPLYSTRIIKGDRNPVYEETAFLMVDVNTMRLKEKLSFQLWDSDRTSVVRQSFDGSSF